ncbi:uncharacterized protein IAS62_002511 [Cryptococcus decagattii]|uniref:Uncharacterized protein n=1 Tax=Cryptococcus decagattii TaxID=1859122 RepID=A0ABZ2ARW1_9TREE
MVQPWDEDPTQKNGEDFEVKVSFQVPFPKELRPWDQCEDNEDSLQRLLQGKSKEELGCKWELFDSWLKKRDSAPFSSSVARKVPGLLSSKEYYVNGLPTTQGVYRVREPGKKPMGVVASGIDEGDLQARL